MFLIEEGALLAWSIATCVISWGLLQAYGHTFDFSKMVHLLRASWTTPNAIKPNLLTYNAAISACCRVGNVGRASRLLHEMVCAKSCLHVLHHAISLASPQPPQDVPCCFCYVFDVLVTYSGVKRFVQSIICKCCAMLCLLWRRSCT